MGLLKGNVTIVTGASRGIGKQIAIEFAKQGAKLALIGRGNNIEPVQEEIKSMGNEVRSYLVDVSDYDAVQNVAEKIENDFGQINVLVNCAGIVNDNLIIRMSEKQWDEVINVNLKSVYNFTKATFYSMLKNRKGSIINLSSIVGVTGNAGQSNYAASKGAIIAMSKSIAKEGASRGVRCNAIAPGLINTDMTEKLPEAVFEKWKSEIPMGRPGTPEEVAQTALFLASDMSSYITGQVLSVCGGRVMV